MYLQLQTVKSSSQNINKKFASLFILIVKKYWNLGIKLSCFLVHLSYSLEHYPPNYNRLIMLTFNTQVISNLAGS